jgi:hypothetical protein
MTSHPSRSATSRNRSGVTPLTIVTLASCMRGRYRAAPPICNERPALVATTVVAGAKSSQKRR